MADSLRDQLIAAGYDAPKKPEKRKSGSGTPRKRKGKASVSKPQAKTQNSTADSARSNTADNQPSVQKSASGSPGSAAKAASRNAKRRGNRKGPAHQTQDPQVIEERKRLKAKIKTLIDDNKSADWKGEVAYRYLVEKRIRELYVTEDIQKKLAERELAVTRLNGDTYLVPRSVALEIKEINPQWSVFNLENDLSAAEQTAQPGDDYAEFQVPDDLKW